MHTEKGISVKEATIKSMREIQGPVIAIVLVMFAVFIPVAFMGGFSGIMYRQFAVTIVISMFISGLVALTLTPALCVLLLREEEKEAIWPIRKFNQFLNGLPTDFQVQFKKQFGMGCLI